MDALEIILAILFGGILIAAFIDSREHWKFPVICKVCYREVIEMEVETTDFDLSDGKKIYELIQICPNYFNELLNPEERAKHTRIVLGEYKK